MVTNLTATEHHLRLSHPCSSHFITNWLNRRTNTLSYHYKTKALLLDTTVPTTTTTTITTTTWLTDREKHALVFHDGSTAAKESNDENQDSSNNTENRRTEKADIGNDWGVASFRHLQPDTNAKHCAAQQLHTQTPNHSSR